MPGAEGGPGSPGGVGCSGFGTPGGSVDGGTNGGVEVGRGGGGGGGGAAAAARSRRSRRISRVPASMPCPGSTSTPPMTAPCSPNAGPSPGMRKPRPSRNSTYFRRIRRSAAMRRFASGEPFFKRPPFEPRADIRDFERVPDERLARVARAPVRLRRLALDRERRAVPLPKLCRIASDCAPVTSPGISNTVLSATRHSLRAPICGTGSCSLSRARTLSLVSGTAGAGV